MTCAGSTLQNKLRDQATLRCSGHCYCGTRFSNWDIGCPLVRQTGTWLDDKSVLRSCAPRPGALANILQSFSLGEQPASHRQALARRVFPGLSGRIVFGSHQQTVQGSIQVGWSDVVQGSCKKKSLILALSMLRVFRLGCVKSNAPMACLWENGVFGPMFRKMRTLICQHSSICEILFVLCADTNFFQGVNRKRLPVEWQTRISTRTPRTTMSEAYLSPLFQL